MKRWGLLPAVAGWLALLLGSTSIWEPMGDSWAMIRYVVRVCIAVPLALTLVIVGVRAFDHFTPEDWLEGLSQDVQSKALVLAAVVLGVVWLAVQS